VSDEQSQTLAPPESARVYPNPSDLSHAYVDLNGFMGSEISLRVFDMGGRVVHQSQADYAEGEFAYALPDLSSLPRGVYTLEIMGADQARIVCKMIRN
jgi:hypothetical protein